MALNRTALLVLTGLAGTLAGLFVAARRQTKRADALNERVEIQDWESAPLTGTVPGANVPTPKEVAKKVTRLPAAS